MWKTTSSTSQTPRVCTRTSLPHSALKQTLPWCDRTRGTIEHLVCCMCHAVQASIAANTFVVSGPSQTRSEHSCHAPALSTSDCYMIETHTANFKPTTPYLQHVLVDPDPVQAANDLARSPLKGTGLSAARARCKAMAELPIDQSAAAAKIPSSAWATGKLIL